MTDIRFFIKSLTSDTSLKQFLEEITINKHFDEQKRTES